jgi:hypothetical protein
MPLVEAVGEPILPGNCQDQNHKRKFVSLLLHRIAASLFLPLIGILRVGMAVDEELFYTSFQIGKLV